MEIDKIIENNRQAWNEATQYHQRARGNELLDGFLNPEFSTFDRDCDEVLIAEIKKIDLNGKVIGQIPCNNGRELLSLIKFGAKEGIGFDLSDTAIDEAEKLAEISKLNVKFNRINILDIGNEWNATFDFIYISEGSLQWFPNLNEYFKVISRLLKPKGSMLIYEMHPFAYFFEQIDKNKNEVAISDFPPYFKKGPFSYKDGLDYVGETKYQPKECYWFMHTVSDIINAIIGNNISIVEFRELEVEMANNPLTKNYEKFPLSYILKGKTT